MMAKKSMAVKEERRDDAVGVPIHTLVQSDMNMTNTTLLWSLLRFPLDVLENLLSMSLCANFNHKPNCILTGI